MVHCLNQQTTLSKTSRTITKLDAASVEFMNNAQVSISALSTGHVSLDIDVFPMDNSNSKKEGEGGYIQRS